MDHLVKLPINLAFEPISVPFIFGCTYDDQGFHEFPKRKGWDIDQLCEKDFQGRTVLEARCFLQAWLFFGMLSECLNSTLDPLDFICNGSSEHDGRECRISTASLEKRLSRWKDRMESFEEEEKSNRRDIIVSCLDSASKATRSLGLADVMGPELHLAVCILGSTLDKAQLTLQINGSRKDQDETSMIGQKSNNAYIDFGPNTLLRSRMLSKGWCPAQVRYIETALSPPAMYFASMLKRPFSSDAHSVCTEDECIAHQVDNFNYQPKHTESTCDCSQMVPDASKIAKIVEEGAIPIIALKPSSEALGLEMRVVSYELESDSRLESIRMPYIAISHVWRDGLGNANGNSLPQCQMKRLRQLVDSVYNRVDHCHNSKLEENAEIFGDGKTSIDDLMYNMKKELSPTMLSMISELPKDNFTKSANALQTFVEESSGKHGTMEVVPDSNYNSGFEKASPVQLGPDDSDHEIKGAFHYKINDWPSRNFMSHHGTAAEFDFDWKGQDLKDMWEEYRLLSNIQNSDEVFIWIDTLCIPRERRLRSLAIQKMKEVYDHSEKVLILDSELQQLSGVSSYEEVLMRINLSGWMQRAWTLEEAAVGSILLVQFQDGVFDLWKFGRTWFKRSNRSIVLSDVSQPWLKIRRLKEPRHHIQQMQMAYDALESRITSRPADLNLIFSFLMGVNVKGLLASDTAAIKPRARTFLDLQRNFPAGRTWVASSIKEENYLSVGNTSSDKIARGVSVPKDPHSSREFLEDLQWLEKTIAPYREEPGFVIRCPGIIVSPRELADYSTIFAFHKTYQGWLKFQRIDSETDVQPRREGDCAMVLLPFGFPSDQVSVLGILISFYMRAHMGGNRLTREGVNFSTFRSCVTVSLPSSEDEWILSKVVKIPHISDGEGGKIGYALSDHAYRDDTMWCLE